MLHTNKQRYIWATLATLALAALAASAAQAAPSTSAPRVSQSTGAASVQAGRPLAAGGPVAYTYDAAGRLVRADYAGGKSIIYTYDPAGNLTRCETLIAPAVTFPDGGASGDVTLSWTHDALYAGYQVWYSIQPYFAPGADCNAPPAGMSCAYVAAPGHTFTHTGAGADVVHNYAYLVLGVAGSGSRSSPSGRVGEFGFGLAPGTP